MRNKVSLVEEQEDHVIVLRLHEWLINRASVPLVVKQHSEQSQEPMPILVLLSWGQRNNGYKLSTIGVVISCNFGVISGFWCFHWLQSLIFSSHIGTALKQTPCRNPPVSNTHRKIHLETSTETDAFWKADTKPRHGRVTRTMLLFLA